MCAFTIRLALVGGIDNTQSELIIAAVTLAFFAAGCGWGITKIKLTTAQVYEFGLKFHNRDMRIAILFSEMSNLFDETTETFGATVGGFRFPRFRPLLRVRAITIVGKKHADTTVIAQNMVPRHAAFFPALLAQYRKYQSGEISDKVEENEYETFWNDPNRW